MSSNPESILDSVKKVLGYESEYAAFDLDVTMFVNSALGSLQQLGVGPVTGLVVEDNTTLWWDLTYEKSVLGLAKSYVYMSVRLAHDPPATSFAIEAITKQIDELGWRVNAAAEAVNPPGRPRHNRHHDDEYRELALELALEFDLDR